MARFFLYQAKAEPTPLVASAVDSWHQPFSGPIRRAFAVAALASGLTMAPFVEPAPAGYDPVNDQDTLVVFTKTFIYAPISSPPIFDIPSLGSWFSPLSNPVRSSGLSAAQQNPTYFAPLVVTPPPTLPRVITSAVSSDIIRKSRFIYQSIARAPFVPTPTPPSAAIITSAVGSDIIRNSRFIYQSLAHAPFTPTPVPPSEVISNTTSGSDVIYKSRFIYQSCAYTPFTPPPAVIYEDKWHFPWSVPVRTRNISTAQQQAYFAPAEVIRNPIVVATASSDVIYKSRFIYQSLAFTPFVTTVEVIYEDKWHYPWSEPVRQKRGLAPWLQQTLAQAQAPTPPIVSFSYYNWLAEPVRQKVGLAAYLQQTEALAPTPPIVSFSYYNWLSEPVRLKNGLPVTGQQSFTFNPNPIVSFGYYGWLSEPVRLKKGLRADEQQTIAGPPSYPILSSDIPWFAPLEEPVRPKKGFLSRLQQFFSPDPEPIPNEIVVTLYAVETNNDIASIYAIVYNRPVRAWVSIKEIPRADEAYASIEET